MSAMRLCKQCAVFHAYLLLSTNQNPENTYLLDKRGRAAVHTKGPLDMRRHQGSRQYIWAAAALHSLWTNELLLFSSKSMRLRVWTNELLLFSSKSTSLRMWTNELLLFSSKLISRTRCAQRTPRYALRASIRTQSTHQHPKEHINKDTSTVPERTSKNPKNTPIYSARTSAGPMRMSAAPTQPAWHTGFQFKLPPHQWYACLLPRACGVIQLTDYGGNGSVYISPIHQIRAYRSEVYVYVHIGPYMLLHTSSTRQITSFQYHFTTYSTMIQSTRAEQKQTSIDPPPPDRV